jgi:hypothetical protein
VVDWPAEAPGPGINGIFECRKPQDDTVRQLTLSVSTRPTGGVPLRGVNEGVALSVSRPA